MVNRKTLIWIALFVILSLSALACGERDVMLVDSLEGMETYDAESACAGTPVRIDEEDRVVVERDRIKVSKAMAMDILEDYLHESYGDVHVSGDEHSDVPGHEDHNHAGGKLQDSHGTISYAFLVEGEDFYNGQSVPMYVDAETGDVYGLGCGLGAGDVVHSPDGDVTTWYGKALWWVKRKI